MQYNILASKETVKKTAEALTAKGIATFVAENEISALEKIKELIPQRCICHEWCIPHA